MKPILLVLAALLLAPLSVLAGAEDGFPLRVGGVAFCIFGVNYSQKTSCGLALAGNLYVNA